MKKLELEPKILESLSSPENWKVISVSAHEGMIESTKDETLKNCQKHDFREILVPVKGEYIYTFNIWNYRAVPGTVFLIDSNVKHEYCYAPQKEELLHLWFHLKYGSTFMRCLSIKEGKIEEMQNSGILPTPCFDINRFWDNYNAAAEPGEKAMWFRYLKMGISLAIGYMFNQPDSNEKSWSTSLFAKAMTYLHSNYCKGVNVEELAKKAGYSRFHFVRLFKQRIGMTVREYVDELRYTEVKRMLEQKFSKKEIASRFGFKNVNSFYVWHRKRLAKQ